MGVFYLTTYGEQPRSGHEVLKQPQLSSLKIEQFLKFFIQGDAENQRQLGRRIELASFDGADGVARDADHLRQRRLREMFLCPRGGFSVRVRHPCAHPFQNVKINQIVQDSVHMSAVNKLVRSLSFT